MLSGCMNFADVERKEMPTPNPTSHVFNLPLKDLQDSLVNFFAIDNQTQRQILESSVFNYKVEDLDIKTTVAFKAETASTSLFGKHYFTNAGTDKDIYLHSFGNYWMSPIYHVEGDALKFRADFVLKLDSINQNKTLLTVETINPVVIKGIEGLGPHGFIAKEESVEPTTVEEYTLIKYIAEELGDKSLDEIIMPDVDKK